MIDIARPPKDKYNIDFMCQKIDEYVKAHMKSVPILKECCLLNTWNYDYVMQLQRDNEQLSQSIKTLLAWKEVRLEQGGLSGQLDKTLVIFSLKQPVFGWTDKQSIEVSRTTSEVADEIEKYVMPNDGTTT